MSSHEILGEVAKVTEALTTFVSFHLAHVSEWLEASDLRQGQSRESKNVSLPSAGIYAENRLHAIG